ncbi:D-arabinono-1,4-lactone oxidase [Leucobacter sp. NPDC058333]|uniref:D-arabinono-1,4-lactone oxidase n=1 Tax=Leucobacter sp. NPDC058333 TaxID=3346450 RepID=UPI00365B3886
MTGRIVRNWGRSAVCRPVSVETPANAAEVADLMRRAAAAGTTVKAIGAGHSFSDIAMTSGVLVDVSRVAGLLAHDAASGRVTLGAGTRLRDLPALLRPLGLALENMGDIDAQTIAGATSTGTHGTGARFGGLATQIVGVTLVDGTGRITRIAEDERPEMLPAARLGLGALGVLVAIELQCVPAFLLHAVERAEPFAAIDDLLDRSRAVDHLEAYWWPHTDRLSTKSNARLPIHAPHARPRAIRNWVEDELLGSAAHLAVSGVGWLVPRATPTINRLASAVYGSRSYTDDSHAVFTSPRRVHFREMEYAIPAAALPAAVRELRSLIERKRWRISFPVELRFAAADDVWLSTAYGRESAYIAVHRYWREDPEPYFTEVEAIMRAYEGRPHWGKMHGRSSGDLADAYPRFADFSAARAALDPDRVFANDYTRRVLGE